MIIAENIHNLLIVNVKLSFIDHQRRRLAIRFSFLLKEILLSTSLACLLVQGKLLTITK